MLENLKSIVKYVLLPLTLLFGFIYYLLQRINTLQSQVARAKSEKVLADTLGKLEEAKKDADEKEDQFHRDYDDLGRLRTLESKGELPRDTESVRKDS